MIAELRDALDWWPGLGTVLTVLAVVAGVWPSANVAADDVVRERENSTWKPRVTLESAAMVRLIGTGPEIKASTPFGCLNELGLEVAERSSPLRTLEDRVALIAWAAIVNEDLRIGVAPRLTKALRAPWALQATAGPVWSVGADHPPLGFQTQCGFIYRDVVSLRAIWQAIPYDSPVSEGPLPLDHVAGRKWQNSFYLGLMAHEGPGAFLTVATWAVALIVALEGLGNLEVDM